MTSKAHKTDPDPSLHSYWLIGHALMHKIRGSGIWNLSVHRRRPGQDIVCDAASKRTTAWASIMTTWIKPKRDSVSSCQGQCREPCRFEERFMTTCREQGNCIAVVVSGQQVCLYWCRRAPVFSSLLKLYVLQSYPWKGSTAQT